MPFPIRGGAGGAPLLERMVGDVVFANVEALVNWSNANLDQLRNNVDPISSQNPWNKSIAQVGSSPNQIVYQWDGENLPSSFPTESAWSPRNESLNASQVKTLYESNPNTNAFDDLEKSAVDSVQAVDAGTLLVASANGVSGSSVTESADAVSASKNLASSGTVKAGLSTIELGEGNEVIHTFSSAGENNVFGNRVTDVPYTPGSWSDGTENTRWNAMTRKGGTYFPDAILQGIDSDTLTNLRWTSTQTDNRRDYTFTIRGAAAQTNVRFRCYQGNQVIFVSKPFTLNATGDTLIDLRISNEGPGFLDLKAGVAYDFDLTSPDGDVQVLGSSSLGLPYVRSAYQLWEDVRQLDVQDIDNSSTTDKLLQAEEIDTRIANSEDGVTSKRYNSVEPRRSNFTLGYSQTNGPGNLYRIDSAATVTIPQSTNDNQLGSYWGIQNVSFGQTVTLQVDTPVGHTITIEGFTRPYEIPAGTSIDLVLVDRTASSSVYRIMNQSNGIEGLMGIHSITGNSFNILGISGRPVHYKVNTAGTANFDVTVSGVGLLPQGESCRALIENVSPTYACNLRVPTGTTFTDTITSIIAIEPSNSIWVTITNNSGTLEVNPDGPIQYEFLIQSHDITNTGDNKGDWGGLIDGQPLQGIPDVYSEIVSSPTLLAERDRIVAETGAGFMMEFTLMADLGHGSESSSVSSLISVRGDRNDSGGTGVIGPTSTRRVTGGTGAAQESAEINKTWQVGMQPGNFFNLLLTGFPATGAAGARLRTPWAKVKITMKR